MTAQTARVMPADTGAAQSINDSPTPRPEVRAQVKDLLSRSEAFGQLPAAQQKQVARDTALIADALVGGPDADKGMQSVTSAAMNDPSTSFKEGQKAVDAIGRDDFDAGAVRAGGEAAADFMNQINFVDFVSGLIDGVFNSIVTSSIEQMEAYSKMVADVSKSLNQFRDENTSDDDGRDQMVEQFPDIFSIGTDDFSDSKEPRLQLRDNVDQESALSRVQQTMGELVEGGITSIDVSDPEAEAKLIKAARSHIATARQQLLATMVMMGLNRIVVTNGKIQARILYDFNASSQRKLSRSAMARDFARNADGSLQKMANREGEFEASGNTSYERKGRRRKRHVTRDSEYYTKGKYKYAERPVLTAMSVASDAQTDQLSARASLAGNVEVNFKSDYLPLEKMATPEMMASIQMRSKPVDHNRPVYEAEGASAQNQTANA